MKYKKNLIYKVKARYGLEELNFFRAFKYIPDPADPRRNQISVPIVVASFKTNPKKIYKKRKDICVSTRLTHVELDWFLQKFSDPDAYSPLDWRKYPRFTAVNAKTVLFEPADTEVETFASLKSIYLITYLAGI